MFFKKRQAESAILTQDEEERSKREIAAALFRYIHDWNPSFVYAGTSCSDADREASGAALDKLNNAHGFLICIRYKCDERVRHYIETIYRELARLDEYYRSMSGAIATEKSADTILNAVWDWAKIKAL